MRPRLGAAVLAAYFLAHLPLLPPSLEDIDSINFALGLRQFDVAEHQPHPPGYPAYVAMGRVSLAIVNAALPALDRVRAETLALSIWSAIAAAVALAAAFRVYRACGARAALAAAVLLAASPLFVISSLRPMSDMPGLAAALVTQALLLESYRDRKFLVLGALGAGLSAGIRTQTLVLTAPLLAFLLLRERRGGVAWMWRPVAAAAAGVLAWGIPLILAAGGLDQYLRALGSQATEDLTVIDLVWTNPTPRRMVSSLYETFVMPWGSIPLAIVAGIMAAAGAAEALARERRGLALMTVAFAPYVVFHLLFQETVHVRYALPAVVPVVWLAVRSTLATGGLAPAIQAAVVVFAGVISMTTARAYAGEMHPAFRAIADMSRAVQAEHPGAVFSHYAVRRPLQAQAPGAVRIVEPPPAREWAALLEYWRGGGSARVWFLADARRTDLALIDPHARRRVTRYGWRAGARMEMSGVRPGDVDWYRLDPPGWFAGDGWSLTPELGGMTQAAGTGVDRRPIEAMVHRRSEAARAVIGARHLGTAADGGVSLSFAIDGRIIDRWELDPSRGPNVLRVLALPQGALAGDGRYARATIAAAPMPPRTSTPPIAIRQFDIQSDADLIYAFDEGWHEEEYDNATGLRWRWTSDRSVLRVFPNQAVRLSLRGESPMHYFDAPPTVRVTANGRVIAELRPDDDFEWRITIPSADVTAADGRIAIETNPVYLPALAEGTTDERRLGLRVYGIDVDQVLP